VNYKFLSKITYNSDFKKFISGKNCHLPMKVIGSGKEMLGEIGFVLDIDTVIEDQHADRYKENP
jgi:hypothetical protein